MPEVESEQHLEPGMPATGYERESRWPLFIGTIAIVYACLGLIVRVVGLAGIYLMPWLTAKVAGIESVPVPIVILIGELVFSLAAIVLGMVLLIGGVATLRQQRKGPRYINLWAVLRLGLLALYLGFIYLTLDYNVTYQNVVRERLVAVHRKNNISEETINAHMPAMERDELGVELMSTNLIFGGMVAVCPIVLGLIMTMGRIRSDVETWPDR